VRKVLREFPDVISQIFYFASRRAATPVPRKGGRNSVANLLRRASRGVLGGEGSVDNRFKRALSIRADPSAAAAAAAAASGEPKRPSALKRQATCAFRRSSVARLKSNALASIGRSRAVCGGKDDASEGGLAGEADLMASFDAAEVLSLGADESNLDADDVRATAMLIASGNLMNLSGEALKLQQKAAQALKGSLPRAVGLTTTFGQHCSA